MLEFDYNEVERLLGGLVKLDSNGAEEWMQIYGDEFEWTILPESIMVVDDGFVGVGAHTTPLEEPPDIGRALCVFKTDSSGELQWHQAYRYGGYINNWARGFCSTDDGGYLIVGDLRISANHWDAVMVKTDSNGYEEWNQTFGGSAPGWETFEDVFQTNDGGYIICGTTESFGAGSGDAWLLRTDATGNEIWNKTFGERYYDVCWGFDSTDDGGYIIPIRIDIMGVNADGWAVKVDSDGIVEWKHIYGESGGRQHFVGICSTSDDGCIASGVSGGWDSIMSDALLVKYAAYGENNAPNAPIITGETSGTAGIEYEYTFNAVDPDGGDVYYWVQWGDSCPSVEWIGPFPSGVDVKLSHTYQNQGTYTISARAKDVFDAESPEGTLKVKMPRNRATYNSLFLKLLEQFPILQTLLQRLGLQ